MSLSPSALICIFLLSVAAVVVVVVDGQPPQVCSEILVEAACEGLETDVYQGRYKLASSAFSCAFSGRGTNGAIYTREQSETGFTDMIYYYIPDLQSNIIAGSPDEAVWAFGAVRWVCNDQHFVSAYFQAGVNSPLVGTSETMMCADIFGIDGEYVESNLKLSCVDDSSGTSSRTSLLVWNSFPPIRLWGAVGLLVLLIM